MRLAKKELPQLDGRSPPFGCGEVGNVSSLGVADLLNDNIRLCNEGARLSLGELCAIRARAIAAMGCEIETETWRKCKQLAKKLLLRQLRDGWHDQQIA